MPVVVFESQHAPEAAIIAGLLNSHGFQATLLNSGTAAMVGVGTHLVLSRVTVDRTEERDALAVLGRVVRRDAHGRLSMVDADDVDGKAAFEGAVDEPKVCSECGEDWEPGFEVCWNCEHELS